MGFLSTVLSSLLSLRIETKRLKKTNPDYASIDSVLGLELRGGLQLHGHEVRSQTTFLSPMMPRASEHAQPIRNIGDSD